MENIVEGTATNSSLVHSDDWEEFNGIPYEHFMSTTCELEEIFTFYSHNPIAVRSTMALLTSSFTTVPFDTIESILSFSNTYPSSLEEMFQISIRTSARTIPLTVAKHYTIEQVKNMVLDNLFIPLNRMRLICHGRNLAEDRTLEDYGIGSGSIVFARPYAKPFLMEAVTAELCLFPTILVFSSNNHFTLDGLPCISQVTDCFGDVPFEQRGDQLLLGRPTVNPVVKSLESLGQNFEQPLIRMNIVRSEDAMAERILAETIITHNKVGFLAHFRSVVAKALGITPLQCSLH
eukprot:PhF_6_TR33562/c0_g1_i1/m.48965